MHIPVRWQFLQLIQVRPLRYQGRAEIGCNSYFHLVRGQ
jgi:hypothetical protein